MHVPFRITAMLAAAVAVSGCAAVVSSHRYDIVGGAAGGAVPAGIPYMLPKALLPVEVVANGASIRIDALEPVFIGDPKAAYVLRYDANAFNKDVVKVEVDPKTSLLKSLVVERKDETGEVLKKLLSTVVRAESAPGPGDVVIYQSMIDPDDATTTTQFALGADAAIRAYLATDGNCKEDACKVAAKALLVEASKGDSVAAQASVRPLAGGPVVALPRVAGDAAASPAAAAPAPTAAADCSIGICHRASLPYVVELRLLQAVRQTVLLLPNNGRPIPLALDGKPFVTVKHTVALRGGIVEQYDVDKPSSALALVSWPLDVYDAIVTTTAKILQLKIDTSRNATAAQEQLLVDAEKRQALEERKKKLEQAESASLLTIRDKPGRIMSVGKGEPQSVLPSAAARSAEQPASAAVPVQSSAVRILPGSAGEAASAAGR